MAQEGRGDAHGVRASSQACDVSGVMRVVLTTDARVSFRLQARLTGHARIGEVSAPSCSCAQPSKARVMALVLLALGDELRSADLCDALLEDVASVSGRAL